MTSERFAIAIAVGVFALVFCLTWSMIDTEVRRHHEREAVRAALRGDCAASLDASIRAGRVPYDAWSICRSDRR